MEGGGGGSFNFMGFGDTSGSSNGGLSTMMMRMPLMTTSSSSPHPQPPPSNMNTDDHHHHHHHQTNPINTSNTLFLPLPCSTSTHHNNNQLINTVGVGHNYFNNNNENSSSCSSSASTIRAKIMAHPHYSRLLTSYVNCQKVGAPPEVVARLEEACASGEAAMRSSRSSSSSSCIGEDPALDQFMEAYCEMLSKYEQELTKPFKEAMLFLSRIECQFKALTVTSPSDISASRGGSTSMPHLHFYSGEVNDNTACGEALNPDGSSDEDVDASENYIDPQAEDRELKGQLLRKYSGYLGSLKQEFLKKRKKGKLPKEARQQLLDWWSRHYKWPYPSESQKLALAESTGLDQKQINNWFINQRKRHWKPSEEMQFVVMDAGHQHYYMDNVLGNPFPMDCTPTLL